MRWPGFIRRSIGRTQALAVLVASLTISVALSAIQLSYTFSAQHQAAIELSEEILALAEGGATTASWTLDNQLAEDVIGSVIALGDVHSAALVDESGSVLASATHPPRDENGLTRWFARRFIADPVRAERQLTVKASRGVQPVGTLSIALSPEHIAQRFLTVATPVLVAGVFQALAIGAVLLWLSSRLVTGPLRRAAAAIERLDPERPETGSIAIPPSHQHNELGLLLGHTNAMVERVATVQDQLRALATHDPLTGLPNRSFIVSLLDQAIARAERHNKCAAVLFVDLDDFKTVNDSHGHSYGDELLVQVGQRLRGAMRSTDAVGRLGGDEFLIVTEDISDTDDVLPMIRHIRDRLAEPFRVGDMALTVHCSIGVAMVPADGTTATDLMRHSDMAMYQSKNEPGSEFYFFARDMSDRVQARLKTEAALRLALERDEFTLAWQPKIEAGSGKLAGCEVLLRWQHEGQLVPAGDFIKIAEQTGLIVEIGQQVLERACAMAREWATRHSPIPIAINVSAQQLRQPNFVERVIATAERYSIDASLLELEITETVLIEELEHTVGKLAELRDAGFIISIDDFGTGYSSLSYLTHLPASSLKIDRSFVSGPQKSDVVLNMILAMAKALKLKTVAEGVETSEQRDRLVGKGCDELQGYLLGKPMSAQEFERAFLAAAA